MKRIITAMVSVLLLAGCSASGEDMRQKCLYDAVHAYPTWTQGSDRVLDSIPSCKSLAQEDKDDLREMMIAFVNAAVVNSQKG